MSIKNTLRRIIGSALKNLAPKIFVYPQVTVLSQNSLLDGRTALITGGTSGIGYSIAKAFVQAGASVIITGRDKQRLESAQDKLKKETSHDNIYILQLDIRQVNDLGPKFEAAKSLVDGHPINILVNNAGVLGCKFGSGTESDYDAVMDTNLKGVFFLSQLVGHYMKENKIQGNILNVGSSSCLRPASSAYTVSKWGIRGLTMGMARSLAPYRIVVNGIAPGPTATPMLNRNADKDNMYFNNPGGRYALPEEIAGMAVILVSNISRMIIGDTVYMTGGSGIITFDDIKYDF